MAQTYTFKIVSVCPGGEYITVRILEDGVSIGTKIITRSEIASNDLTAHDVLPWFLKKIVANSGATTAAQRKTAIEAASVIL